MGGILRDVNGAASLHGNTDYRPAVGSDPTSPSVICRGWLGSVGVVALSQTLPSRGMPPPAGFSGRLSPHGLRQSAILIAALMPAWYTVIHHCSVVTLGIQSGRPAWTVALGLRDSHPTGMAGFSR